MNHGRASCQSVLKLTLVFMIMTTTGFMITSCGKTEPSNTQSAQSQTALDRNDPMVGCYTVSYSEPAQIKISLQPTAQGEQYVMQMRQFNDTKQGWDNPEPMQVLESSDKSLPKYFDIKADEHQYLEKVIARPDRVFVLAKVTDSFASLNPQFDSPYLGYIYKGSNTIYKVSCDNTTQV